MALTKSLEDRYKFISLAPVKRLREGMSVGRSSSTIKLSITVNSTFDIKDLENFLTINFWAWITLGQSRLSG